MTQKIATSAFTTVKPNISMRAAIVVFIFLLLSTGTNAQSRTDSLALKQLYDQIALLDTSLFDAYNACNLDKVATFFTDDLEFYHEKGGLTLSRDSTLDIMRKNLCGENANRVRREIVKNSLEVHPINNYGAVQTGEHRFYLTQKGQKEKLDGIGKFVMLWQHKDGEWKISRAISYGFTAPPINNPNVMGSTVTYQDVSQIRNFLRIDKEFCTAGQPKLEQLAQLKADGVKSIINLRVPTEHRAAEEEGMAKELGLRYFNIPVAFGDPKDQQVTEFLKLTDDPENRPVFIHCAGAIRVGAFWMIRRVLRDGWSIEKAEEEAKKIGLRESPHLNEFARNYIARYQKK